MTKKIITITTLLFISSMSIMAQNVTWGENFASRGLITVFNNNTSVQGSPYLEEEFLPAKIQIGDESKVYGVRYNAYDDIIELKNESDETIGLNESISNVSIAFLKNNKLYRPYKYINPDNDTVNNKKGYFVVEDDTGEKPLLLKEKVVFIEAKEPKSGYDDVKPAKFKRMNDEFYTLNNEGVAVNLPKNKKKLAKIFPNNSKKILNFIKSNKIKTSKREDLILLFGYINTLK
ncbi:hypothetical protein [Winogradskyella vidalii]|uniref:hypothetical protein n=1 Tax=Winogradskyella vidalii TaxID=2615024 RepID=UPI0015CD7957|nr:hypothetical protein [Winogradskyella vidalii]